MKPFLLIGAAAAVIGIAAYCLTPRETGSNKSPAAVAFKGPRPTTTNTNPTEVFQRAFWKHPSPADQILHAERREWAGGEGVKRWQWFIVVEASPELMKHLRQDNAFGLIPAESLGIVENPPEWFTPPPADVFRAPNGNLRLAFSKTKPLLYAMDMGGGFASGAPEPMKEMPADTAPAGRLPKTPPPK
jgi:hypothetical protein